MPTKPIAALLLLIAATAALTGCNSTPKEDVYRPYFDARVDSTGRGDGKMFRGRDKVFLSDINSEFAFTSPGGLYAATGIDDAGNLVPGETQVLAVEFTDSTNVSIIGVDDKTITMRLQVEADGKISRGWLGGKYLGILAVGGRLEPDIFMQGQVWLMYQDNSFAAGQLNAEFNGYRINGNFRVLKKRR